MAKNPERYILSCSYNAMLASDFGRQVRDTSSGVEVQQAFPDFTMASDSRAADVWRTEMGGAYFGVGIGGTTTGRPANLLIVDDPVKSREDAESATQRNKIWDFYTAALSTRLQPDKQGRLPSQIVILTRWHPDDLAGRLMETQDWKEGMWMHLDYPAIKKVGGKKVSRRNLAKDHPMYVESGELSNLAPAKRYVSEETEVALWPERFPLEELRRRERLNPRDFASLYQQKPYIEGGNILKSEWWRYYPEDLNPKKFQTLIIAADTAFKKTETADYSVAVVAGLSQDGDIYVVDVHRGRWDFPELRQRLISINAVWRGSGLRAIYIEDKASGQSIIQDLRRESGMAVVPYKVQSDKVSRVNSITPMIQGGRVYLPQSAPWLDTFVDECVSFPSGRHDDQVDALSMAVDILSRQAVTPETVFGSLTMGNSLLQDVTRAKDSLSSKLGSSIFKGWGE
jgi:predicted phage terminase large subunit-like protein